MLGARLKVEAESESKELCIRYPLNSETVLTGFKISTGAAILFYSIGALTAAEKRHLRKFMRPLLKKDFI